MNTLPRFSEIELPVRLDVELPTLSVDVLNAMLPTVSVDEFKTAFTLVLPINSVVVFNDTLAPTVIAVATLLVVTLPPTSKTLVELHDHIFPSVMFKAICPGLVSVVVLAARPVTDVLSSWMMLFANGYVASLYAFGMYR